MAESVQFGGIPRRDPQIPAKRAGKFTLDSRIWRVLQPGRAKFAHL
jgi:hypothetical protein